ncbi:MAG: hypothetical protein Q7S82_03635 [bacterium]|nr:hypothetical protein [bacterium]
MQNKKYFYQGLTVVLSISIIVLGWVYLVQGTSIGTDIETVNLLATGTSTMATTTIGTNFYIDEAGNASTTGNFLIGSGTAITKVMWGTVAIDPDQIATSTTGIASSTVTGLTTDMVCVVQPPDILNDDLIPKGATTTEINKLGVYLYNPDQTSAGANIDDGNATWGYFCIK